MEDNHTHRYSSDDFGAVDAPFFPSPSEDPAMRMAHALEYIACALSIVIDNPEMPPAMENKVARHPDGEHQVIKLEASDRHWTSH